MSDRPVLITGAAGFFGLAIVRALAREGFRVLATDRVEPAHFAPRPGTPAGSVEYERRDLEREPLDDLAVDSAGVVYAAALTPADETDSDVPDRLLRVNLEAFLALLGGVRRSRSCRRVLFVSSAGVYAQGCPAELDEADADGGSSLYGAAKLAAELVGRRHAALLGWDFGAVRPTSLIGPGEVERPSRPRVTPFAQLVDAGLTGQTVRLERPGSRADWLAVDDAADAVALLWRTPRLGGRSFNVSSGRLRPLEEVASAVSAVVGLRLAEDADVVVDGGPDRAATIVNARLGELGWHPRRSLETTVRDRLAERAVGPARDPGPVPGR